jgi:hypothetical protein
MWQTSPRSLVFIFFTWRPKKNVCRSENNVWDIFSDCEVINERFFTFLTQPNKSFVRHSRFYFMWNYNVNSHEDPHKNNTRDICVTILRNRKCKIDAICRDNFYSLMHRLNIPIVLLSQKKKNEKLSFKTKRNHMKNYF